MTYFRGWDRTQSYGGFNWMGGPGELFREMVLRRKLTPDQLAVRIAAKGEPPISPDVIQSFLDATAQPTELQMKSLAIGLGLPDNWFIGEED